MASRPVRARGTSRGGRSMAVKREALTLRRLKALLDVTSVVRGEKDLASVLSTIVRTVAEALEFRTVVLNLYRPAFDDFCVTTVHGSPDAQEALLGSTYDWESWQQLLVDRFRHDGAYLIPHGSFDWSADIGDHKPNHARSPLEGLYPSHVLIAKAAFRVPGRAR